MRFAICYGVNVLHPTSADAALYQQYLANSLTAPASRRNYLSGARIWIQERGGDPSGFQSYESLAVAKGAIRLNPHIPKPAPALTPLDLQRVCTYLDMAADGPPLKAALCIGYFAFLRASNLLSPTASLWGGPHTLLKRDIVTTNDGLYVVIRSSKTIFLGSEPIVLALPKIDNSPACPTQAWISYTDFRRGSPFEPAFTLGSGRPVTPTQLTAVVRQALKQLDCPYAAQFSGHSLRRGGTHAALQAGCNKSDIASHGTWAKESGMKPYLPSNASLSVANKLATLFGT